MDTGLYGATLPEAKIGRAASSGRSDRVGGCERPDVVVVGSGFGGAVTAARLAEQGLKVLVLERGPWWQGAPSASDASPFPRGPLGMRRALRGVQWARGRRGRAITVNRRGLLELSVFEHTCALSASGVGGGSLVYADGQSQPDDAYFDDFPAEVTGDEMRGYYDRVRSVLAPSPIPERPWRSDAFARGAAANGFGQVEYPDLAVDWRDGSARRKDAPYASMVILGCDHDGKRSLDRTYIPIAIRHGAEVRAMSEVVAIARARDGYRVDWVDDARRRRCWVKTPRLVLAAGTLGTLRLLFGARDRDRSLQLPDSLGRGFSAGGDVMSIVAGHAGTSDAGLGPSPGAILMVQRDGVHRWAIVESGLPVDLLPLPAAVRARLRNTVALGGMSRDSSAAQVTFDGRAIRSAVGRDADPELYAEIERATAQIADSYGAKRVLVNLPAGPGSSLMFTAHPLGGARMADRPEDGVVDHRGEVFGNSGLFVADAAAFSRAPGCPPSMTIAALAERQSELIGEAAGLTRQADRARPQLTTATAQFNQQAR